MNRSILGLISGLIAASIWGGMYVVSKVVLDVIPPFMLLSLRLILGAAMLGGFVLFQRKSKLKKQQFRASFLVGFVGYGVSLAFQFIGTKLSTASNGALVT
ncbi:MAG TPA: DMT family transporter, partial [Anaerolineales bacterium]|nr:DMT family transporter [Anaerolineales bacterium]